MRAKEPLGVGLNFPKHQHSTESDWDDSSESKARDETDVTAG